MPPQLDEGPSDEDIERFGDATVACPECGASLYDDAQVCYKCGHALGGEDKQGPRARPVALVIIVLVILALTGAAGYALHWF
jgi:predicted nucleic acid-binding Zn ribbon protein